MENTPVPWYTSHDGDGYDHIQSAAINEDNYVARVDSMDAKGNANADLIIKAVNNHSLLIDALIYAHQSLRTFSPAVPQDEQGWTSFDSDALAVIEEALASLE